MRPKGFSSSDNPVISETAASPVTALAGDEPMRFRYIAVATFCEPVYCADCETHLERIECTGRG
jgi:hypothetical protein